MKKDFEEMKMKMKQQDELIEHLQEQLEKNDITSSSSLPPSRRKVIKAVIPTVIYEEDSSSNELD